MTKADAKKRVQKMIATHGREHIEDIVARPGFDRFACELQQKLLALYKEALADGTLTTEEAHTVVAQTTAAVAWTACGQLGLKGAGAHTALYEHGKTVVMSGILGVHGLSALEEALADSTTDLAALELVDLDEIPLEPKVVPCNTEELKN